MEGYHHSRLVPSSADGGRTRREGEGLHYLAVTHRAAAAAAAGREHALLFPRLLFIPRVLLLPPPGDDNDGIVACGAVRKNAGTAAQRKCMEVWSHPRSQRMRKENKWISGQYECFFLSFIFLREAVVNKGGILFFFFFSVAPSIFISLSLDTSSKAFFPTSFHH